MQNDQKEKTPKIESRMQNFELLNWYEFTVTF